MRGFIVKYWEPTRELTKQVIGVIATDKIDWTYRAGKFSIADWIRYVAAIERNVFMRAMQGKKATYRGGGSQLADGYENVINYLDEMH